MLLSYYLFKENKWKWKRKMFKWVTVYLKKEETNDEYIWNKRKSKREIILISIFIRFMKEEYEFDEGENIVLYGVVVDEGDIKCSSNIEQ